MNKYAKEKRLEDIRRACLNCGHQHFNHAPCCDDVYCVSDMQREISTLKSELSEERRLVDSIAINSINNKEYRESDHDEDLDDCGCVFHDAYIFL